jgi:hypothetical protein
MSKKNDKLKVALKEALTYSIDSEKSLEIIIKAITEHVTDEDLLKQAVNKAVNNYESQLRIFMIAAAKEKLKNIQKLMKLSETIEDSLSLYESSGEIDAKDLVSFYHQINRKLKSEQEFIKTVADQRLEILNAMSSMKDAVTSDEILDDDVLGKLDSSKRDRVRRLVDKIIDLEKISS